MSETMTDESQDVQETAEYRALVEEDGEFCEICGGVRVPGVLELGIHDLVKGLGADEPNGEEPLPVLMHENCAFLHGADLHWARSRIKKKVTELLSGNGAMDPQQLLQKCVRACGRQSLSKREIEKMHGSSVLVTIDTRDGKRMTLLTDASTNRR